MIEHLIEYCCRHKFIVILFYIILAGAGYYVMRRTPVDAIPDLSENQVIVFTDWPGRSPKEIEDQITYPLSVNLQGLAGVKTVRSSSEFNFSTINIIFEDSVDFYFARTRVLERLALASTFLPERVVPYMAPDATALGQIFWYTVESSRHDLGRLRALEDWYVRYQLNSVPGVAQVSSVGGFPREYQVDVTPERLRAYDVTLGQIYEAIARANSSVGGRVVQKGNAEYLIRGVGWIRSVEDLRRTVVVSRNGVPVRVGDVASVQMGSEFRRSVLEKDGREVTGGVVMMRYGENPLEVTKRIKAKVREIQKGLPEGVRIVPFYDRTRLIESAVGTVTGVLKESMIVATIAILLIMAHVRSIFVVVLTLPLAILIAFMLMRVFNVSSNIMSLSGITISVGILVDQAIVMLENATHRLTRRFGKQSITGDTTDLVAKACRQVGRPIFFSVVIMVVSFIPVFALTGQEGKLFHPLAYTKTFALVGTAIIAVTLVPALIPLLIKGRLSLEENNWIVRSVLQIYRPTLRFLMRKPKTVIWLFVILLGIGVLCARHLGREFMPPLDEGGIMDMPVTAPRASVTEVADDIKARDAMLRAMPEVEMVVGKAGRADTPTDPSPLDMIETVINLRPREHWVKRRLRPDDVLAQTRRTVQRLVETGALAPFANKEDRETFIQSACDGAVNRYDAAMRFDLTQRMTAHDEALGSMSIQFVMERLLAQADARRAWKRELSANERQTFIQDISSSHAAVFAKSPQLYDLELAVNDGVKRLAAAKAIDAATSDILAPVPSRWAAFFEPVRESLGGEREDFYERTYAGLERFREAETRRFTQRTNREIFAPAMRALAAAMMDELANAAEMLGTWKGGEEAKKKWIAQLTPEFERNLYLWPSVKADLVRELDVYVRQLGWSNIWTQPIINRVDMLATGVRTQLAVLVYGPSLEQIQESANQVAGVLRGIQGAADVVADQSVGKGYVEVEVDRERAARYGVSVGEIQDIIEIALGGKAITTTVEGRERYPVRLRYSRDYRTDEESIKRILVSTEIPETAEGVGPNLGKARAGEKSNQEDDQKPAARRTIYLGDVTSVTVIEGPVMIKSENGLLRAYVQLNVRDRDVVGFVEEAQRLVASKIKPPEGVYFEWAGQFEHQVHARKTLRLVFPAVLFLIFVILYITYNDLAHAMLMMLAVPGALAGGVIFQTLFGYNFSVAVWVGYIACFGMATETGIIMLVYLRDAIAERGGLQKIASLEELEHAVMDGAVHRLRPKLLTEGTTIIGVAPMLWAKGVGAEVIAPMAAPVLGGLLVADEVIDIFLPVLFYQVEARRWKKLHPTH